MVNHRKNQICTHNVESFYKIIGLQLRKDAAAKNDIETSASDDLIAAKARFRTLEASSVKVAK